MNIIQKSTPNYIGGRSGYKPQLIVLHIMQGSLSGTDNWFASNLSQVSANYGIGLNGEVHQYVQDLDTAWAEGRVNDPTAKLLIPNVNPNEYCLSIEHEGTDLSKGTQVQWQTSAQLIYELATKYGIPLDRDHIIGHYEIYSLKPNCPATDKTIISTILSMAQALVPAVEMTTISVPSSMVDKILAFIKTL